jgi:hypothetical protein
MLGVMPLAHPRTRPLQPKLVPALAGLGSPVGEPDLLGLPGPFGVNYPATTVVGFFARHLVFGMIVDAIYGGVA